MITGERLRFRVGDVDIAVRSDLPELVDDLGGLYETTPEDEMRPTIDMEVRTRSRLPRRYDVFGDGEPAGGGLRRREVLPYLEWGVNCRFIAGCRRFVLVHAASMSFDGQGVVFAGSSGAGKSTLVAGLAARGWRYLCDEFALIDPVTLGLVPFPKAVCVKAGGFDLVRRLGLELWDRRHYVKALKGRVGYIRPADLPRAPDESCPVRLIVFPRYTGHPEPRMRRVPPGRAAFTLATHTLNRTTLGNRATAAATRLAQRVPCVGIESGALDKTCRLIETLLT